MRDRPVHLSEHLLVHRDAVNVGIVRDGSKALLVDLGPSEVLKALPALGVELIEMAIFTHHHRDQACGATALSEKTKIGVPRDERAWFEDVSSYWKDPAHRWHLYNFHPHHWMLAEPVRVDVTFGEGDVFDWGPARISVLSTPGHTDGSVSYVVDVDGQRTVFCGDTICDEGKLHDIYSLQKGIETTDYHGFMGARQQIAESLRKIMAANPSRLIPSHGAIINRPDAAIHALVTRMKLCYDKFAGISALRFYFPHLFASYSNNPEAMPIRPGKPPPHFLRHFGTSWVIISRDRAAFVIDCGSPSVIDEIRKLQANRDIDRVEYLWITHYHDDHVDAAASFREVFGCPVIADAHVATVIENPFAWRLPCISPVKVTVDRRTQDSESWRWHEFEMTAYHLPGQTYYHGGLLVEGQGLRLFFAGDSFTMSGIDDYCSGNRNFLGEGSGYDLCIRLLKHLRPTHIFNCHLDEAFDFTGEQLEFMRANLAQRGRLFGELLSWDNPNFGMDEQWIRCLPYEQEVAVGDDASLKVVITNHSSGSRRVVCRATFPSALRLPTTDDVSAVIPAGSEGEASLCWHVPSNTLPGLYVVTVDVRYECLFLPQAAEAILHII